MGSGLSMTSVNKIKELALAREYSMALEIIDSQDLTRSLNPQFIRLCGDVYIANKRYKDARKVLVMAHKMAPEAKRVIYSLVELYLKTGYKDLADFYYRLYMFDAEPNLPQTDHIQYIYSKAQGCPLQEIEALLFPMYSDVMDYDWSFELYLLMKLQGKDAEARSIKEDYIATYKNEPNAAIIEELEQFESQERLKDLFNVYSCENVIDDDPEQEEIRVEEKVLIEADELRMNPKEAEIQIEFDDNEKASFGAKLKYKMHIKGQERLAKKAEKNSDSEETESDSLEKDQTEHEVDGDSEVVTTDDAPQEPESLESTDYKENVVGKTGIFRKLFSKKRSDDAEVVEVVEDTRVNESIPSEYVDNDENPVREEDNQESEDEQEIAIKVTDVVDDSSNSEEDEIIENEKNIDFIEDSNGFDDNQESYIDDEVEDLEIGQTEELSQEEPREEIIGHDDNVDTVIEEGSEEELAEDIGDSDMQEIYGRKKISIVTEVGEDTFVNSMEVISGNPFDEIKQDKKTPEYEEKKSFVFEEVDLLPEEDEEYEIDDFSGDFDLEGFDEGGSEYEESANEDVESEYEESAIEEIEPAYEEPTNEDVEPEYEESTIEDVEPEYEEPIIEDVEPDYEESTIEEAESIGVSASYGDSLNGESVYNSLKSQSNLDFPEFKTTLFPDYGQEVVEVENNFREVMSEAQDKINENLIKEEQMQREAEALLASLGIDIGNIKPTIKPEYTSLEYGKTIENSESLQVDTKNEVEEPVQEVYEQPSEETQEVENKYSPSRDELKASLKIDSVKKNILKHIKEHR